MSLESPITLQAGADRWKVLLVDDEPAVHDVSRLVLADLSFEGKGIELLSACSAAEAREIFARNSDVALVLLDVVMETDDAGIALVQHIREHCNAGETQIVMRTGQPGMAPERDVVLRYEINGYVLKTELSAQRLHSIVVSALRNYRHARSLREAQARDVAIARPSRHVDAARDELARELAGFDDNQATLMQAQPEIRLASNAISGIELVPHWRTSRGLLPAARICEAMTDETTRSRIVHWLLSQGVFWANSWRSGLNTPLTVSIPVIGESLADCNMLGSIIDRVRESGLPPGSVDFLVSETTWSSGHPDLRTAVTSLREVGVSFTVADFGAQRISLQRLNHLVPDRLKIHRLFVRDVANDADRRTVARSLIALAHTLNIEAIADGISSDSDAQFFKWEGCNLAQGDALAPACAPADVAQFLSHGKRAAH